MQTRARVGAIVGVNLGAKSDVRVGAFVGRATASIDIGDPGFPELEGKENGAELVWRIDTQDSPVVPSGGVAGEVRVSHLFEGPELTIEGETLAASPSLTQLVATATRFWSLGPNNRLFAAGGAGTSFEGRPLATSQFSLGLPFRLGAYSPGELRGGHFYVATVGYPRHVTRLPDFLGGPVFAGGWLENADTFDKWSNARWRTNGGIGLVMDTLVGPVLVAGSWGFDGRWRTYLGVGRLFR